METKISKGRDGWEAVTMAGFDAPRVLRISTGKGGAGVVTHVTAVTPSKDGGNGFYGFSFVMYQDYSKRIMNEDARCTVNTVKAQHALALEMLPVITAEARAFYAAKADKREAA